jgi:hypothetical protein
MSERAIGLLDQCMQLAPGDLVRRDVQRENLDGEINKGVICPLSLPVFWELGDAFWDV